MRIGLHADTATVLRDYDASELTVEAGEVVTASFTESGWAWVTNAKGSSGCVPLEQVSEETA